MTPASPRLIGGMPLPSGFIPPCLPTKAAAPPSGEAWLHEIKHDGFRVIARKDGDRVRLFRPLNEADGRPILRLIALLDFQDRCLKPLGHPSKPINTGLLLFRDQGRAAQG